MTNGDDQPTIILYHRRRGGESTQAQKTRRRSAGVEDKGNGLTVSNEGYFDKDVSGLGDEAFCTGSTLSGAAGVLVRKGDRLLYVSILPGPDFDPSQLGINSDNGVITNDTLCQAAQKAASSILG